MLSFTLVLAMVQTPGASHDVHGSGAHAGVSGTVVVMSRSFALDLDTAQKLCPDGARLRILVGARDSAQPDPTAQNPTAADPLSALGAPTTTLGVDANAPFAGDQMDLAQRVSTAACIVLEGGTWSSWWRLLEPMNKRTRLGRALAERHATGGNVIGIGPAGAFLCEYSLLSRRQLQIPSRNPHDLREHVLVEGLGLVRGACFDFAMDGRTNVEPLFDALRSSRVEQGVWLTGSCAWIQTGDGPLARVAGPDGAAYVFDLGSGRRSRDATFGGRAARFAPGDRFEGLPSDRMRGTFRSVSIPFEAASLDAELRAFPWPGTADAKNPANSRKAVEFRGKGSRLRLFPEPGDGSDVPPPAHAPRPDWIRFDWIPIASAGIRTRVEPQVALSSLTRDGADTVDCRRAGRSRFDAGVARG
jgi:hypothetical protein